MKNDITGRWYILCDTVVELTLCHMECSEVSVGTDSDGSPIAVTGGTSKKKNIYLFSLTRVIGDASSHTV